MIITSQGISSSTGVKRSINYITRDGALTFTQNMLANPNNSQEMTQEILENMKYLEHSRGKNLIFSETLSMPIDHNISKEKQTEILKDLVAEHTRNRQLQNHLGVFSIHTDKNHTHVHCIYSANELLGTKRARMSKKDFLKAQQNLENYRNKNYPQLKQTNHYSKLLEKRVSLAEGRMKHLRKAITKKEIIVQKFKTAMTKKTNQEFHSYLKEKNLALYVRGKKTIGLRDLNDKRNYRLNTLEKNLKNKYVNYQKSLSKTQAMQQKQALNKPIYKQPTLPKVQKVQPQPVQVKKQLDTQIEPTHPSQYKGKKYGR